MFLEMENNQKGLDQVKISALYSDTDIQNPKH